MSRTIYLDRPYEKNVFPGPGTWNSCSYLEELDFSFVKFKFDTFWKTVENINLS